MHYSAIWRQNQCKKLSWTHHSSFCQMVVASKVHLIFKSNVLHHASARIKLVQLCSMNTTLILFSKSLAVYLR